jgi:alpha-D-xyloside xylohydrolase
MQQMQRAHENGIPPMRPLFVDFPFDPGCYQIEDEYMFGPDLLVAPVIEAGARSRDVYLPSECVWKDAWTAQAYEGGQHITIDAPLERIPLFLRGEAQLPIQEEG